MINAAEVDRNILSRRAEVLRSHIAAGSLDVVNRCIEAVNEQKKRVIVNLRDNDSGLSALHIACVYGSSDIISLLRRYGDSDLQDNDGNTPLHILCQNCNTDPDKYLPAILAFICVIPETSQEAAELSRSFRTREDYNSRITNKQGKTALDLLKEHELELSRSLPRETFIGYSFAKRLLEVASDRDFNYSHQTKKHKL